jgi:glycosyltransferase involved in cell wall biosynthesis
LLGLLRKTDFAWVHSNSSVIGWGAWVARKIGRPHLWHLREFGDLDYGLERIHPREVYLRALRDARCILCVSHAVAEHHGVADWPQTRVLYNGVMPHAQMGLLAPETVPRSAAPLELGVVGFLAPGKGFETAIRALPRLSKEKGVRLHVFGSGPAQNLESLRDLAHACGVSSQIHFHGFVADPVDVFRQIDVLLVTAQCEAFGRTTAEAMAWGVPVIGRASGGTLELIEDGEDGLLFDGTPEHLAARIGQLHDHPGLRDVLRQRALEKARSRFTTEAYVAGFRSILSEAGLSADAGA